MGGLSIWHWLVVLVIVLLVFGTKRLSSGARDLGNAVKEFKKGVRDEDKPVQPLPDASQQDASLQDASLQDASLQDASLQDASLQDASLQDASPQSSAKPDDQDHDRSNPPNPPIVR